jgi:hypothetical protein
VFWGSCCTQVASCRILLQTDSAGGTSYGRVNTELIAARSFPVVSFCVVFYCRITFVLAVNIWQKGGCLLDTDQRFAGACCFGLRGGECSIPEDSYGRTRCHENLKSRVLSDKGAHVTDHNSVCLDHLNAGIVACNPAAGMDLLLRSSFLFCLV